MSVGGVGGGVGPSLKELSKQAKALGGHFKQIKPGDESEAVQRVAEEAKEVLSQLAALQAAHPGDKKIEKKIGAIRKLFEPILQADEARNRETVLRNLEEKEVGVRTNIVMANRFFQSEGGGTDFSKYASRDPGAQLDVLKEEVDKLMQLPPPLTKDDSRLVLARKILEDKRFLAEFTNDIAKRQFQAYEQKEREKEEASGGAYKARLGWKAFAAGAGGALVAQLRAMDPQLTTRDILEGPLEQTKHTKYCDEIVHALLIDPDKVVVTEKEVGGNKKYYIKLSNEEGDGIELGVLLADANFSQIHMSKDELTAYAGSPSLMFKPYADDAKLIVQITGSLEPLTEEQMGDLEPEKKAQLALTPEQRRVINNYTKEGVFSAVNTLFNTRDGGAVLEKMEAYLSQTESRLEGFGMMYRMDHDDLDAQFDELKKNKGTYLQERAEWTKESETLTQERQTLLTQMELFTAKKQELDAQIAQLGGKQASPEIASEQERLATEEEALKQQETALAERGEKLEGQGKHLDEVAAGLESSEKDLSKKLVELNTKITDLQREEAAFKATKEKFGADRTALIKEALLHAAAFNTALDLLPTVDLPRDAHGKQQYLYRVVSNLPESVLADLKKMGDEKLVMWAYGFTSSSQGAPSAKFQPEGPTAVKVLKATVGKNISALSDFPEENEVLLGPTQVQVMGTAVDKDSGVLMVYEEPVGGVGVGPTRLKTPGDLL